MPFCIFLTALIVLAGLLGTSVKIHNAAQSEDGSIAAAVSLLIGLEQNATAAVNDVPCWQLLHQCSAAAKIFVLHDCLQ